MLYQNLSLWYYIVSKVSSVFMEHLYYIYKINAQEGGMSKYPAIRAATHTQHFPQADPSPFKSYYHGHIYNYDADDITNSNFHNNLKFLFNSAGIFCCQRSSAYTSPSPAQGSPLCSYPCISSTRYSKLAKVFQSALKREAWCSSQQL